MKFNKQRIIDETIEYAEDQLEKQITPFSFQFTTIGEQELTYIVMRMKKPAYNGEDLIRAIVIAKSSDANKDYPEKQYVANIASYYDFDELEVKGDGGRLIQYRRETEFIEDLFEEGIILGAKGAHADIFGGR